MVILSLHVHEICSLKLHADFKSFQSRSVVRLVHVVVCAEGMRSVKEQIVYGAMKAYNSDSPRVAEQPLCVRVSFAWITIVKPKQLLFWSLVVQSYLSSCRICYKPLFSVTGNMLLRQKLVTCRPYDERLMPIISNSLSDLAYLKQTKTELFHTAYQQQHAYSLCICHKAPPICLQHLWCYYLYCRAVRASHVGDAGIVLEASVCVRVCSHINWSNTDKNLIYLVEICIIVKPRSV